jgi:hypothetical protein
MRVSKLVALAGALAAAWLARSARASELSWEGAPDCPDRGQLLFELERALGKPLSQAGPLAFHVTSRALTRASRPAFTSKKLGLLAPPTSECWWRRAAPN